MADPALNTTRFNGQVWVNLRIERVTNLLYHFRRLKQGDDLRVCASHLTSPELLELKKALELLGAKPEPEPSQCLALVPLDKSETDMVGPRRLLYQQRCQERDRLMADDPSLSHEEALALVKRAEEAKKAEAKDKAKPKTKPRQQLRRTQAPRTP